MSILSRLKKKRALAKAKETDENRRHSPFTGKRNPGNKSNLEMEKNEETPYGPTNRAGRNIKNIKGYTKSILRKNPGDEYGSRESGPPGNILDIVKSVSSYNKNNPRQDDNKFTKKRKRKRIIDSLKNKVKKK